MTVRLQNTIEQVVKNEV